MDQQQIVQQQRQDVVRGVADIVLLIDHTTSMADCIEGLKANIIKSFVNVLEGTMTKDQRKVDWRARVVTFGDVEVDGQAWLNNANAFVSDASALVDQIKRVNLQGGGDSPETAMDAIYIVLKSTKWRERVHRFVVLLTDAPAKPTLHEGVVETNEDCSITHLQQLVIQSRVKMYGVAPSGEVYNQFFGKLPKSQFDSLGPEDSPALYEGLKNQNFAALLEKIAKTVSNGSGEPVLA